jgi:S1-C subfamily serine protease
MSEPQEPEDLSGSEGRPTPQPEDTQPERAAQEGTHLGDPQAQHAQWYRAAADNDTQWLPPQPGGPYPGGFGAGPGYPGGVYAGGGYPGGGYPGGGYQGAGYPGGPFPPGGYPAGSYPAGWQSGGRGGRTGRSTAALVAVVALVAAGIGAGIAYAIQGSTPSSNIASTTPNGSSGQGNSGSQEPSNPFGNSNGGSQQPSSDVPGAGSPANVSSIAAKVDPALVDVNVTFGYQNTGGAGTGIVLTPNGEVLTNNHVIDGATSISVTDLGNGKTYGADVVGYDSTHDIAVLQLTGASGLQTAVISKSAPAVGEGVVAIGNVGGAGGTPTASGGSVTALDQSITASDSLDGTDEQLAGMIETNADVQAGDSGGSLVDSSGQVVGMDTAASSGFSFQSQGSAATQGFAIPISQATATAKEIEAGDGSSVVHVGATAFLGIQVSTSGEGSGSQGQSGGSPGAVIAGLVSGGVAEQAGLAVGDVITSLAGRTVTSADDVSKILVSYHPGDSVQVGWTDTQGQSHTATIDLGTGPPA